MIVILKKRKTHFSHLTHLPAHGQRQQRKKVAKSLLSRLILMRSGRIFAAFSWRPGKLLCGLKTYSDFGRFCYLNIPCFRINTVYYFNLYEFLKRRIHALVGKLKNRCFRWFPAAMFVPLGTQTRRLRTIKFKKHNWMYILNNSNPFGCKSLFSLTSDMFPHASPFFLFLSLKIDKSQHCCSNDQFLKMRFFNTLVKIVV